GDRAPHQGRGPALALAHGLRGGAGVDRQHETEVAALAELGLHPDLSAVALDDEPADVEPEAGARDLEVLVAAHALELLEQLAELVVGDPEPVVDDFDDHVLGAAGTAADGDRSAGGGGR